MQSCLVLLVLVAIALSGIDAHSYLTTPISRANQRQTQAGCRGPGCLGPCEVSKVQALTPAAAIARGDTISVTWPRNNHAGGFVRYAWATFDNSDDPTAFDSGAQLFTCFEIGTDCKPSDPSTPNGGDTGAQFICTKDIVVPGYLTDGKWTFQWAWFGGAFTLGDYYGCVDYNVAGGPSADKQDAYFTGGDYANPGNNGVCKFFNTDRLHNCVNEPCNNPNLPGENTGPPFQVAIGTPPPSSGIDEQDSDVDIPCQINSDCPTGVCQIDNICYKKGSSKEGGGLDAGGIAALFFAFLFILLVVSFVIFVVVNKSEWGNWRPFNRRK